MKLLTHNPSLYAHVAQVFPGRAGLQERNDCTVRALAECAGIPYYRAHEIATKAGRKPRHRCHITMERLMAWARAELPDHNIWGIRIVKPQTIRKFVSLHPHGIFFCLMRGHCFAIKDGIVFDTFVPGAGSRITAAWQFNPNR